MHVSRVIYFTPAAVQYSEPVFCINGSAYIKTDFLIFKKYDYHMLVM